MTTEEKDAPAPIQPPPEFPVTWEKPEFAGMFWNQDRMHFPETTPPMQAAFVASFNEGVRRASAFYGLPLTIKYTRVNTYFYNAMALMVPPEDVESAGEKAGKAVGEGMGRLQEWWDSELLPEVKEHLKWWEDFDLEGASMPDLRAHLDETMTRLTRLWDIHFLVAFPFIMGPSMFAEFYEDLFADKGPLGAYKLLQGFGNKTVDGGHALWELSRKALQDEEVASVIRDNEAADVTKALAQSDAGKAFLVELEAYLEEFGQRSDRFADMSSPGWIENPVTAIQNIKNFVLETERDMPSEIKELAKEREELIAETRQHLKGYPEAVRGQFEFLLKAARAGTIIQEDHNYWIDQRASYKVRRVILEFGNRFVKAGIIDDVEDIFLITLDELREIGNTPSGDRRSDVADRRAEMERFAKIRPPDALGTPPASPPPDDPFTRALGKFGGEPPKASEEAGVINGNPCSPGKATGTARIVMSLAEADKLKPGDVMIAPATMPAWTPLFASIAAVVTDAGGVLSHAGIVAREYNIPAVLGTGRATSEIKDGQQVEVDGDAGVVRVIS
ncbi:MAG: hypothetical protein IIB88_01770 [Chloroflexi bacterium]|nr:hypothetical protein [Chloroflexota bacterium]